MGKHQKAWKRKLNSFIIPPARGNDIIISPIALTVLTPTHRNKLYFQNTAYITLYIQNSVFLLFNQFYFTTWQNYLYMEKEMATHSSILAWKILWTEVPGRLQTMGSQRIRNNWVCTHKHTHRHTKTEDVEHILMCLLATCIYSLVLWCSVCKIFCPFLCDCLSVADLYSFFMYSWCKSFINSINFKYILQSCPFLCFISRNVSFTIMRSNLSIFYKINILGYLFKKA